MKGYYLGIDTSCYTTSCALVNEEGKLLQEERKLLEVKLGGRGLAQSNMVFQHTRALPILLEKLALEGELLGVGISAFPRREENSYMPAFLVGKGMGESLAHFQKVPCFSFAHQENHILAALREAGEEIPREPFFALHVSGGTTELVYAKAHDHIGLESNIIGATRDLHGGQFVDRVGVALGLSFPAGPALEKLAHHASEVNALPLSVKEGQISFSGPASEALRRIEKQSVTPEEIAKATFMAIGKGLTKMIDYHLLHYPIKRIIAVGGVMANSYLRADLEKLSDKRKVKLQFASPKYSSDNATGVAYGAYLMHKQGK